MDHSPEDPEDSLEQDLADALDSSVQQSVNKALARGLEPFTRHLQGYAHKQGWISPPPLAKGDGMPTPKPCKAKAMSCRGI